MRRIIIKCLAVSNSKKAKIYETDNLNIGYTFDAAAYGDGAGWQLGGKGSQDNEREQYGNTESKGDIQLGM